MEMREFIQCHVTKRIYKVLVLKIHL